MTHEEYSARLRLGERALALVLRHEWAGTANPDSDDDDCCVHCGGDETPGHKPGCEWGAICDAARALG